MPRKNRNVRTRNVPRGAQPDQGRRTKGAHPKSHGHRPYTRQPSAQDRADSDYVLHSWDQPS